MIKRQTNLKITDNSGVKIVQCIGFFKSIKCETVTINDFICVCLKKFDKKKFLTPKGKSKHVKKQKIDTYAEEHQNIYRALIISSKRKTGRIDGSFIKTAINRALIVSQT